MNTKTLNKPTINWSQLEDGMPFVRHNKCFIIRKYNKGEQLTRQHYDMLDKVRFPFGTPLPMNMAVVQVDNSVHLYAENVLTSDSVVTALEYSASNIAAKVGNYDEKAVTQTELADIFSNRMGNRPFAVIFRRKPEIYSQDHIADLANVSKEEYKDEWLGKMAFKLCQKDDSVFNLLSQAGLMSVGKPTKTTYNRNINKSGMEASGNIQVRDYGKPLSENLRTLNASRVMAVLDITENILYYVKTSNVVKVATQKRVKDLLKSELSALS